MRSPHCVGCFSIGTPLAWNPGSASQKRALFRRSALFAATIRRDQPAVQAALDYAWSSRRIEGQITNITLVKRQMFGRGSIDLLKQRPMRAG